MEKVGLRIRDSEEVPVQGLKPGMLMSTFQVLWNLEKKWFASKQ